MRVLGGIPVVLAVAVLLSGCAGMADRAPRPRTVPAGWQVLEYGRCSVALPGDWTKLTNPSSGTSDRYRTPDGGLLYLEQFTEMSRPPANEPLPEFVAARNRGGRVTETARRPVAVPGSAVAYRITGRDTAGAELAVLHAWGGSKGAWLVLNSPQGTDGDGERVLAGYTCAL